MENYLFKFFTKKEYVDSFREGKIRLMSAYYYATLEEEKKTGAFYNNRYDATEGKSILINREKTENPFTIKFSNGTELLLGAGVQNFLMNTENTSGQLKISCFYALENKDIPSGKFKEALDTMEDSLGEYYITFLNPEEFALRIQKEINKLKERGIAKELRMSTVKYFDAEKYSGITHVFQKPDKLKWQHEYRLLVETINEPDPFVLDIGDICDITAWGKVEDLRKGYVVDDTNVYIPNIQK